MGLSNNKQALVMLIMVLMNISAWIGLGAPTDKAGLLVLANGIITGTVLTLKELLGSTTTTT